VAEYLACPRKTQTHYRIGFGRSCNRSDIRHEMWQMKQQLFAVNTHEFTTLARRGAAPNYRNNLFRPRVERGSLLRCPIVSPIHLGNAAAADRRAQFFLRPDQRAVHA
jgi:hypothetical protein